MRKRKPGGGRKPSKPEDLKTHTIAFKCTEEEYNQILQYAKDNMRPLSQVAYIAVKKLIGFK